jgi:hypothetical protein
MAWKTPRFRVAQASSYDQLQPSTNADKLSDSLSESWTGIGVVAGIGAVVLIMQ